MGSSPDLPPKNKPSNKLYEAHQITIQKYTNLEIKETLLHFPLFRQHPLVLSPRRRAKLIHKQH